MAFKSMILNEVTQRVSTDREKKSEKELGPTPKHKVGEKGTDQHREWISNNV